MPRAADFYAFCRVVSRWQKPQIPSTCPQFSNHVFPFFLFHRSSLSQQTPRRLSCCVGIIRGFITKGPTLMRTLAFKELR